MSSQHPSCAGGRAPRSQRLRGERPELRSGCRQAGPQPHQWANPAECFVPAKWSPVMIPLKPIERGAHGISSQL